jgi:hypothetical protein
MDARSPLEAHLNLHKPFKVIQHQLGSFRRVLEQLGRFEDPKMTICTGHPSDYVTGSR